jgi:hypothetical protein
MKQKQTWGSTERNEMLIDERYAGKLTIEITYCIE